MMKKISILILVSLVFSSFSYPQSKYKDPFESLLPQEVEDEIVELDVVVSDTDNPLPPMAIEGILWGGDFLQVIIDGEVYRTGDKLKNIDAQVFKVEKGGVFISYKEKIYRMKVGKKEEI